MREQVDAEGSSRRGFLGRTAVAGGALLALGGGTGLTLAQEDGDGDEAANGNETDGEMTADFDDVAGTDVDVLNYALSLEHLEDAFYREALDTFDESDFVEADALQMHDEQVRREVYGFLETAGEHEAAHVEVLTQAVELLGGDPAAEASYDFGIEDVEGFLSLGQTLENTGVAAYAGAAPFIESPDLVSAAVSIHSVEARHAAALNVLNVESPAPDAFDPSASQDEVLGAVGQFIESDGGDMGEGGGDDAGSGNESA